MTLLLVLLAGCTTDENFEEADVEAAAEMEEPQQSVVEMIKNGEQFGQLEQLLEQAGLIEVLSEEGPFTVFAPTDAAFALLDEATLEGLRRDTSTLRTVLSYHVVPELLLADQVPMLESETTLHGADLQFGATQQGVQVNGAGVIASNAVAANGVVHAVDEVLIPADVQDMDGF